MIRMTLVLLLAWPALAFPVPKGRTPDLAGTTWKGFDHDQVTTFKFNADGTMSWSHANGTYLDGVWKLDGATLTWGLNQNYSQFEGTLDGDTITGRRWNKVGLKWELKIERVP